MSRIASSQPHPAPPACGSGLIWPSVVTPAASRLHHELAMRPDVRRRVGVRGLGANTGPTFISRRRPSIRDRPPPVAFGQLTVLRFWLGIPPRPTLSRGRHGQETHRPAATRVAGPRAAGRDAGSLRATLRLLHLVAERPLPRDVLTRRLKIDVRGFYRDFGLVRTAGVRVEVTDGRTPGGRPGNRPRPPPLPRPPSDAGRVRGSLSKGTRGPTKSSATSWRASDRDLRPSRDRKGL